MSDDLKVYVIGKDIEMVKDIKTMEVVKIPTFPIIGQDQLYPAFAVLTDAEEYLKQINNKELYIIELPVIFGVPDLTVKPKPKIDMSNVTFE